MATILAPLLLAGAAVLAPAPGTPADQGPAAALERCRQIPADPERLACLDAEVGRLLEATRAGRILLVDQGAVREARRNLFGFSLPRLALFGADKEDEEPSEEVTSTIQSARDIGGGRYRIRLADGGAVWETTESFINFDPPAAGQKVVIRRGPLGSFMIRIAGQRGVRGRRVG